MGELRFRPEFRVDHESGIDFALTSSLSTIQPVSPLSGLPCWECFSRSRVRFPKKKGKKKRGHNGAWSSRDMVVPVLGLPTVSYLTQLEGGARRKVL